MAKRKRHAGRRLLCRFECLESRQLLAADLQRVIRLSVLVSAIWTIVTISDCHGSEQRIQSLLSEKCLDCHSGDEAEADLELDALAAEFPWVRNRNTWRRVVQLVEMRFDATGRRRRNHVATNEAIWSITSNIVSKASTIQTLRTPVTNRSADSRTESIKTRSMI